MFTLFTLITGAAIGYLICRYTICQDYIDSFDQLQKVHGQTVRSLDRCEGQLATISQSPKWTELQGTFN